MQDGYTVQNVQNNYNLIRAMDVPVPDTPEKAKLRATAQGLQQALMWTQEEASNAVDQAREHAVQREEAVYERMRSGYFRAHEELRIEHEREGALLQLESKTAESEMKTKIVAWSSQKQQEIKEIENQVGHNRNNELHMQMKMSNAKSYIDNLQNKESIAKENSSELVQQVQTSAEAAVQGANTQMETELARVRSWQEQMAQQANMVQRERERSIGSRIAKCESQADEFRDRIETVEGTYQII